MSRPEWDNLFYNYRPTIFIMKGCASGVLMRSYWTVNLTFMWRTLFITNRRPSDSRDKKGTFTYKYQGPSEAGRVGRGAKALLNAAEPASQLHRIRNARGKHHIKDPCGIPRFTSEHYSRKTPT